MVRACCAGRLYASEGVGYFQLTMINEKFHNMRRKNVSLSTSESVRDLVIHYPVGLGKGAELIVFNVTQHDTYAITKEI